MAESKSRNGQKKPRKKFTTRGGLQRETVYVFEDEGRALEERAKRERCSKSEILRRALRRYLAMPEDEK